VNKWKDRRWVLAISCIGVILTVAFYLWMSWRTLGLGFPLDDAWIHQSYARNLVQRGEWAFLPGQPSAGSTSPLWAVLISIGHALGIDPKLWTYTLGAGCLLLLATLGSRWMIQRDPSSRTWAWFAAALIAVEWHLAWAAVSGMEVLVIGLAAIIVLDMLEKRSATWSIGVVIGVGVWLRPEALLLTLPVVWVLLLEERQRPRRLIGKVAGLLVGMGSLIIPYLCFNRVISGEWWPTTFYAKQAEYAILRQEPLLLRILEQFGAPLIGALALLLPGMVLGAVNALRRREWVKLAPHIWVGAHLGAYAWRLPLTYQHARYAIPVVPVMMVLGVQGLLGWIRLRAREPVRRVVSRAWLISIVIVTGGFWFLGARAYGQDVAIIESEMVASAHWISENTEMDAIVAAHDIGALGYFGDRDVLDLAGLVDAEVIPILRDEEALAEWLDTRQADYLMTFPGWYPQLTSRAEQVFSTEAPFSPAAGMENMTVFSWR
jgi:hypothetical protein